MKYRSLRDRAARLGVQRLVQGMGMGVSMSMSMSLSLLEALMGVLKVLLWVAIPWGVASVQAQTPTVTAKPLVMASTTSTEQSGLFAHLLPAFKAATGLEVKVIAVGTGQALDIGRRGDADVLFVHDPQGEELFVSQGHSLKRQLVMYNDFVLIGTQSDPEHVRGLDVYQAFKALSMGATPFISRGDKSGTHVAELRLWQALGLTPEGAFYRACGCGMGPALNMAAALGAYVLSDRGTWLNFKNRGDLDILVQGDRLLLNQYGVLVVNPLKHPGVNERAAQLFANWVTSKAGQARIASYQIGGQSLFFPNAHANALAEH